MSQIETLRKWRDEAAAEARYTTAQLAADKILTLTGESADAVVYAKILYDQRCFLRAADILSNSGHIEDLSCRRLAMRSLVAAEKLDEALALSLETDAQLKFLEGEIWSTKNSFETARDAYLAAIRLDQTCYEAFDRLVSHCLIAHSEQLELIQGLDLAGLGNCADLVKNIYISHLSSSISCNQLVHNALGNLREAYELGSNTDVMAQTAEMLQVESNFEESRQICEKVLAVDPFNTAVYPVYVAALHELGDSKTLFKVGHRLAEEMPDSPITWIAIGAYYLQINKYAEARRNFSKATIIDPLSITAWLGFAHTFANENEHERSITAYSTASRLFPGSHLPYLFLGMQYLHLNNLTLASDYLLRGSALCSGNDPLLLNELAVLHYNRNDLPQAKVYIDRSLEIAARHNCDKRVTIPIIANLGYIERKLGNLQAALEIFEKVARQRPGDANNTIALGIVHMSLGNKDMAVTCLTSALATKRNDPIATEMLDKVMKSTAGIDTIFDECSVDWHETLAKR